MLSKHGHPKTPKQIEAHYSSASRAKRLASRWDARVRMMQDDLDARAKAAEAEAASVVARCAAEKAA